LIANDLPDNDVEQFECNIISFEDFFRIEMLFCWPSYLLLSFLRLSLVIGPPISGGDAIDNVHSYATGLAIASPLSSVISADFSIGAEDIFISFMGGEMKNI